MRDPSALICGESTVGRAAAAGDATGLDVVGDRVVDPTCRGRVIRELNPKYRDGLARPIGCRAAPDRAIPIGSMHVGGLCEPNYVTERSINFERLRRMRRGSCYHEWLVTAEWLDRFSQGLEACPQCGTDCCGDDRPNFCADPEDPMHNDEAARQAYWYHTSTHENWPDSTFDPAAGLTDITMRRMEAGSGVGAVERWAARQKAKALHIGTYEAAIESMFRRMRNQGDSHRQFYLYRIRLHPNCVIEPGVHDEPTNWVGDAHLSEVCSPGTSVLRYVNVHEDPSSLSLAIEPSAVGAVQRIRLPLDVDRSDPWIVTATQRLLVAASKPSPESEPDYRRQQGRLKSALSSEALMLELAIAADLPPALRRRFSVGFDDQAFELAPDAYPAKLIGLARLVTGAQAVLEALDAQPWHTLQLVGVPARPDDRT